MPFEITNELIERVNGLIHLKDDTTLLELLGEEHHADIAEV